MAIEYKTIRDPNFVVVMEQFQEALLSGWLKDEKNPPFASFTYYDIHLVRDVEVGLEEFPQQAVVFPKQPAVKRVGRNKAV